LFARGGLAGIATALVALAVAELFSAIIRAPLGAPIDAVGELSINHTPPSVKDFAIREFGSHDKAVLVWGIRAVLIIFAIFIGVLAVRKLWQGMIGLAIFTAIGIYAALSQPTARASDALPTLVGGAAAAYALQFLCTLARGPGAGRLGEFRDRQEASAALPDRRKFLLVSAAAAGVSLVTYAGGSWLANTRNVSAIQAALKLPPPAVKAPPVPASADLNIPGLSSFITPNSSFYRVDTALVLPEILPAHWQLRIHGMVERELVLSFHELLKRPLIEDYITLCCVSNPVSGPYIGNAKWLGASLRSLLQEAGIKAGADELLCTSSDGFTSGTPVQTAMDGRDALLAVAMNGKPLPVAHGFPVRLVIPGLYGYVSACKWIVDIEVTTYAANSAYWVQRGWSAQAPVKTESRIDVPGANAVKAGNPTSIAGVAWAQHKGIEAVEVRVAGGSWQEARLAAVPGIDCWRQWVYDWNAHVRPGNYLIEARATDKTGYTQTPLQVPPVPNGASGYPSAVVQVVA
jgi:DMSO/TMAO reductase YedYZ molybdopterin-dependent catalytic subunit